MTIDVPAGTLTLAGTSAGSLVTPPDPEAPAATVWPMRRQRRAALRSPDGLWAFYQRFELDLEAGVGTDTAPDPWVQLRWSDDAGHTWGHEHWVRAGAIGAAGRRAVWHRLGRSRHRVWEVTTSDPVRVAWMTAWVDLLLGRA